MAGPRNYDYIRDIQIGLDRLREAAARNDPDAAADLAVWAKEYAYCEQLLEEAIIHHGPVGILKREARRVLRALLGHPNSAGVIQ